MKLGIFFLGMIDWPLKKLLKFTSKIGYEMAEIGAIPGWEGGDHLINGKVEDTIQHSTEYMNLFKEHNMGITAFHVATNHTSPDLKEREVGNTHFKKVVELANKLEVPVINSFSGNPWVGWGQWYDWLPSVSKEFEEGWRITREVMGPLCDYAQDHNVKIAVEVHPNLSAHNVETGLRLIKEVGSKALGFNFDPSHFVWQMADPVNAVYEFKDRIFTSHAKDVEIMKQYSFRNGMLTPGVWTGGRGEKRSWRFRIPGWGDVNWRQLISAFVEVGYDYVISFENEDPVMSCEDGAKKAYQFLKPLIIEKPKKYWRTEDGLEYSVPYFGGTQI